MKYTILANETKVHNGESKMKTLKTKHGIEIEVHSIDTFTDNAKILEFGPHHYSRGDYVEGFEVNMGIEATLADGTSKSFTVVFQSADRLDTRAHGLADMSFAQYYGADWDESGKLGKFVSRDWDEVAEFLIGLAEDKCKKWYDDNKDEDY